MQTASRRRFLGTAAAVGAGAVVVGGVGRWLAQQAAVAGERLRVVLPRAADPLPPVPAGASVDVAGVSPFVTPNASFYRIDTALTVPRVSTEGWTMGVTGYVDRPLDPDLRRAVGPADGGGRHHHRPACPTRSVAT